MRPKITPRSIDIGPDKNRPNNGPRLALGLSSIGPKKPQMNPVDPSVIAHIPVCVCDTKRFFILTKRVLRRIRSFMHNRSVSFTCLCGLIQVIKVTWDFYICSQLTTIVCCFIRIIVFIPIKVSILRKTGSYTYGYYNVT
jgi:hypothetical protein